MPEKLEARTSSDALNKMAWFLTGAILGASVALLYAPKAGRDTRRVLSRTTQRGKEAVEDTSRDLIGAGRDLYDRGRRLVDDAAELFDRGRKLVGG